MNSWTATHLTVWIIVVIQGSATSTLLGHTQGVTAVTWPERKTIYSASWDHSVRQWDVQTVKETWNMVWTLSLYFKFCQHHLVGFSKRVLTQLIEYLCIAKGFYGQLFVFGWSIFFKLQLARHSSIFNQLWNWTKHNPELVQSGFQCGFFKNIKHVVWSLRNQILFKSEKIWN